MTLQCFDMGRSMRGRKRYSDAEKSAISAQMYPEIVEWLNDSDWRLANRPGLGDRIIRFGEAE